MGVTDLFWMTQAYNLARKAKELGEVPVGAVVVHQDKLIGSGYNQVIRTHDPTAHAEIVALREAAATIKNYRLSNTKLYVTLEPCAMCAGALLHARVERIIFATRDFRTGAAGSVCNLLSSVQIDEGVLQSECAYLLRDFFQNRR